MKVAVILTGILFLGTSLMADPYAKCVVCHGKSGERAALGGKSKVINDMTKAEIVASLKGYQDGSYGGAMKAMMQTNVKGLSAADIDAIANQIGK